MIETMEQHRAEYGKLRACRDALDSAELSLAYNSEYGAYQKVRKLLNSYCHKYSKARVNAVIVNTVVSRPWEGQFTPDVRKWADEKSEEMSAQLADFPDKRDILLRQHPAILNAVARQMMKLEKQRDKQEAR